MINNYTVIESDAFVMETFAKFPMPFYNYLSQAYRSVPDVDREKTESHHKEGYCEIRHHPVVNVKAVAHPNHNIDY